MLFSSGGALGVLTSTLCGCFSGGTAGGRARAPGTASLSAGGTASGRANAATTGDTRLHKRGRGHPGQARAIAFGATWHDVQDTQTATAPAPS